MFNSIKKRKWVLSAAFFLVAVGFFTPFWPLAALGVLVAALYGATVASVVLGLLLDIAYGPPVGVFSYLLFPFTLLAAVCIVGRYLGVVTLYDRGGSNTL